MSVEFHSRKVVQIENKPAQSGQSPSLYALCDDGTMWVLTDTWNHAGQYSRVWAEIPDVPQPS